MDELGKIALYAVIEEKAMAGTKRLYFYVYYLYYSCILFTSLERSEIFQLLMFNKRLN